MKKFYEKMLDNLQLSNACFFAYYDEKRSYADAFLLMQKMNAVLSEHHKEKIVLYTGKSFEAYCGIFAIMLSGNSWCPVSVLQPVNRVLDILIAVEVDVFIADSYMPKSISDFLNERGVTVVYIDDIKNYTPIPFKLGTFMADDIAYIMFTSGSTGTPKGVPMTHGNYIPFIENALEILPIEKHEVFSDYHDFSFDLSIFYLFCAVMTQSALSPALSKKDNLFLLNHAMKNKVTVWSSVPSSIARIKQLRPNESFDTQIKIMFLCGEPFRLDILEYCYNHLNQENVFNFYGLTETGVENFYHECRREDLKVFEKQGFVPIGKPLPGNRITISEDNELLIGGPQITPGYIGGLDNHRFITMDGIEWFCSGDIVEQFEDVVFCKGRMDSQVKISGYRIELFDVEAGLRKVDGISEAVCFVDDSNSDHAGIVAVVEAEQVEDPELKKELKKYLPAYMIPAKIFKLIEFPINKSGKLDRAGIKKAFIDCQV